MKKLFIRKTASAVAAVSMALSSVGMNAIAERPILGYMGDINHDDEVSVADLVALNDFLIGGRGLPDGSAYNADMNYDGRVNVYDLVILRGYIAGTRPIEPIYGEEETTTTTTTIVTTTPVTTTTTVSDSFIDPPIQQVEAYLPSHETGNLVIFYVDFPDCKYSYDPGADAIQEIAFGSEDTSDNNYPFESMHAFYERSSKGSLDLEGKVFRYTAKENQSAYNTNKDKLVQECYEAFDAECDFSQFDGDGDGHIDATLLTVPTAAGDDDWWPCAGPSGLVNSRSVKFDGKQVGHLITGNAQIESATDYYNFNSSYLHEMGHCMGLPDYYLYSGDDNEGLHGMAGSELMDTDASTDFGALSKLQLGWYTESQIQVYDKSQSSQTFKLKNAQTSEGNCVIIPVGDTLSSYNSEYFIIEYTTKDANNSKPQWWQKTGNGIRIYHASAELYDNGWWVSYKYESGADEFTNSNAGRRYIRLVNDTGDGSTDNYFRTGDVISSATSGFNWYDTSGNQTIDPGVSITVGELTSDGYTITISKK